MRTTPYAHERALCTRTAPAATLEPLTPYVLTMMHTLQVVGILDISNLSTMTYKGCPTEVGERLCSKKAVRTAAGDLNCPRHGAITGTANIIAARLTVMDSPASADKIDISSMGEKARDQSTHTFASQMAFSCSSSASQPNNGGASLDLSALANTLTISFE